jgi:hypothetical protein
MERLLSLIGSAKPEMFPISYPYVRTFIGKVNEFMNKKTQQGCDRDTEVFCSLAAGDCGVRRERKVSKRTIRALDWPKDWGPLREPLIEFEHYLIHVAPAPRLARFDRLHDRVLRAVKVFGGVFVLR